MGIITKDFTSVVSDASPTNDVWPTMADQVFQEVFSGPVLVPDSTPVQEFVAPSAPAVTAVEVLDQVGLASAALTSFLIHLGLDRGRYDALPEERRAAIAKAAESRLKKRKWELDLKFLHDRSKELTAKLGLKYIHLPEKGQTLCYRLGIVPGTGTGNNDEDWGVFIAVAQATSGKQCEHYEWSGDSREPFCRRIGKTMAAHQMSLGRYMSVNLAMWPGETRAKAVKASAWGAGTTANSLSYTMKALVVEQLHGLFGLRVGASAGQPSKRRLQEAQVAKDMEHELAEVKAARAALAAATAHANAVRKTLIKRV